MNWEHSFLCGLLNKSRDLNTLKPHLKIFILFPAKRLYLITYFICVLDYVTAKSAGVNWARHLSGEKVSWKKKEIQIKIWLSDSATCKHQQSMRPKLLLCHESDLIMIDSHQTSHWEHNNFIQDLSATASVSGILKLRMTKIILCALRGGRLTESFIKHWSVYHCYTSGCRQGHLTQTCCSASYNQFLRFINIDQCRNQSQCFHWALC